jgi:mannose-6-phosphate isomerase-like protein (cupin superfamily)
MKRDLSSTFVVLQPDHSTALIEVTPTVFEELDRRFDGFRGRVLISSFRFDSDWVSWEMHPVGDEVVCLLSGEVTLVLERLGVEEAVHLREPGAYVVIPKGIWHTARTSVATKMLFVTPGEGTKNKAIR